MRAVEEKEIDSSVGLGFFQLGNRLENGNIMDKQEAVKLRITGAKIKDILLMSFALLGALEIAVLLASGATSGEPYADYYHNVGVRLIILSALGTDLLIILVVFLSYRELPAKQSLVSALLVLSVVGAILSWTELWYGSTFYYGEVRDKQGLPFEVNNFGPIGSFIFLTYALWRISLLPDRNSRVRTMKMVGTLLLLLLHFLLFRLVEEPWKLWQS